MEIQAELNIECKLYGSVEEVFSDNPNNYSDSEKRVIDGGILVTNVTFDSITVAVLIEIFKSQDTTNPVFKSLLESFEKYGFEHKTISLDVGERHGKIVPIGEIVFNRKQVTKNKDLDTERCFEGSMKSDVELVKWVESNRAEYPLKLGF